MQSFQSRASHASHHSIAGPCVRPSRCVRPARVVSNAVPDDKLYYEWVFYDRKEECKTMQGMLRRSSPVIRLMTGPPDCGKTALLGQLAARHPGKVLYLDLRQRDTTSPTEFAAMLAQEMLSAGVTFTEAQLNLSGLLSMTLKSTAAPSTPGPLGIMQQILEQWMTEADQQGAAKPLLIIDEANRLADWKEDAALQGLLDMLVRVSKQDNKCHVILGTSEDFMYYWLLHRGLRQNQVVTMTLGNLSEEAAKSFVDDELLPGINSKLDRTGFNLEPSMWPQLYAVCGGNFGALRTTTETAANLFNAGRSLEDAWTAAFREKLVAAQLTVKLGFNPANLPPRAGEKPAWTPRQWGAALEELTEAPHHVVPEERMVAVLGRYALLRRDEAGRAALESLVRFNLLSLRRPSEIAFDLPPEVYGDDGQVTVVTVPYQASLAYILSGKWKQIRQLQLPRFIDRWWPWQL